MNNSNILSAVDKLKEFFIYDPIKDSSDSPEEQTKNAVLRFLNVQDLQEFDKIKRELALNHFLPGLFADFLCSRLEFITFNANEIYVFNKMNGLYEEAEGIISLLVKYIVGENTKPGKINDVIGCVKANTYVKRDNYEPPAHLTPINNGILNTKTGDLEAFNKNYFFVRKLHVTYDVLAKCPNIEEFLKVVLPNEKDRETWLYMVAYCFVRHYEIQKLFVMVGGGSNGKSTGNRIITSLLGNKCISNRSIQDLCNVNNRFSKGSLYQRYANIVSDLPKNALTDTGGVKTLTGGDWINTDVKFKNDFEFQNHAKLIFSANELPRTPDETDAFFRRFIILDWNTVFTESNVKMNLIQELTTEEELSGLLNLLLPKIIELSNASNFKFPSEISIEETRTKYLLKSNPIGAFALERCLTIEDEYGENGLLESRVLGNEMSTSSVYNAYLSYCKDKKFSSVRKDIFGKLFLREVQIEEVKRSIDKKQVKFYRGLLVVEDKKKAINENKYQVPKYKASDEEPIEEDIQGKLIDLTKEEDENE